MAAPRAKFDEQHGIQFRRIDSFEEAHALSDRWDALAGRVGADVFNTFDWCAVWWRHFGRGRKLAIHVAFCADRLIAVWPTFRETIWWGPIGLRVVRIVGCDHGVTTCNVLNEPEFVEIVAPAMMDAIEEEGSWDLVHFGELPGYAENIGDLGAALRLSRHACEVIVDDDAYPQAVFDVPVDYEAYLAGLSLKERRNVRRDERELQKFGAEATVPQSKEALRDAFDELINLHGRHWRGRGRFGHFSDVPGVEWFHRDVAERCLSNGRLAMVEVKNESGVLTSEYALRFNRRLHWIIGGRAEDVTSRVGFAALMRMAIADGMELIDALPGAYDYKRRLGARSLSVKMIWVLPREGRGAIRRAIARAIVRAVSLAYHRVWFWHLAPWFMIRMPHLASMVMTPGLWERFSRSRFLAVGRNCGAETVARESTEAPDSP